MQGYEGCQNKRNNVILTDPGSNPSASKIHIQCDRVHLVHVDDGDVEVGLTLLVERVDPELVDLHLDFAEVVALIQVILVTKSQQPSEKERGRYGINIRGGVGKGAEVDLKRLESNSTNKVK